MPSEKYGPFATAGVLDAVLIARYYYRYISPGSGAPREKAASSEVGYRLMKQLLCMRPC